MSTKRKVSVIGLGYVGLTTAVAFGQLGKVIAFDLNPVRIKELNDGHDSNEEVSDQDIKSASVYYTGDSECLKEADFHIISVPTPLDHTNHPDLSSLLGATQTLAKCLKKGDIVVYESTVYPGETEEKCIPLLQKISKLEYKKDFTVVYSPERINPGDKDHTFFNIIKIISASDEKTLTIASEVYKEVISAGVFPVSSIRVAEAIKIIENIQRDINISYMNEIAILLHKLGIDTAEVIEGMKTKWNYLAFKPGLVGGHCISVNSYYLLHKADQVGYRAELIMAAREINEDIVKFIAEQTIKQLIRAGVMVNTARIAILGITYKENCSDLRDTRVIDIIKELAAYGVKTLVHDPIADPPAVKEEYGIDLIPWDELNKLDAIIITVAHKFYIKLDKNELKNKLNRPSVIMDIKEIINKKDFADSGIIIWKL